MKLPNPERAIIEPTKLIQYLLNTEHKRGGHKAYVLLGFGYRGDSWQQLEADIRRFHLHAEAKIERQTPYGTRYQIRAPLQTPSGRMLTVKTVWQIDEGTDFPRLVTLFPD